jgi:hypothetical protein
MIKIINDNGRIWAVRVVRKEGDRPLVEFYDCRFEHTPYGQFVSRYFLDTVIGHTPGAGLCLDGGVPSWSIGDKAMDRIVAWLKTL